MRCTWKERAVQYSVNQFKHRSYEPNQAKSLSAYQLLNAIQFNAKHDIAYILLIMNSNFLDIFQHRLESPTRSLLINAGKDILIKSGAGNIDANCLNDIRIQSTEGSVSTTCRFLII